MIEIFCLISAFDYKMMFRLGERFDVVFSVAIFGEDVVLHPRTDCFVNPIRSKRYDFLRASELMMNEISDFDSSETVWLLTDFPGKPRGHPLSEHFSFCFGQDASSVILCVLSFAKRTGFSITRKTAYPPIAVSNERPFLPGTNPVGRCTFERWSLSGACGGSA